MRRRLIHFSAATVLVFNGFAQGEEKKAMATSYPPVTIKDSHSIERTSSINGILYSVYVLLPDAYHDHPDKTYPVLYTLDAQSDFSLLTGMLGALAAARIAPSMILVGITVPDVGEGAFRQRDYVSAAGAAEFLQFLADDLVPFIEGTYRADPTDRVLVGTSFAGFFVFYTLFHQTDLFHRYLVGAPSLWWDDGIAFRHEENYAQSHQDLPVKLFMATGEFDSGLPDHRRMYKTLMDRQYPGLTLTDRVVVKVPHASVKPEAYSRGLRALYARPVVQIEVDVLDQYVGRWGTNPDSEFILTLTRQGTQLFGQFPWENQPSEIFAESPTQFWSIAMSMDLHFHPDANNQVKSMTMLHAEGNMEMEKLTD